ncbi:MAG TPA: fatty acyl-AMP ligase [Bdellovibrionota bacterium]|jgi:acyl-CoA synthetase (AMP-forming)/AMP-acid ligase II|nr:fatty acyl-AMP ligase [Bdellovibrionota bacterium]
MNRNQTPKTLVDLLRVRAQSSPDRTGYIYLRDGNADEETLTYGALDRKARAIAAHLRAHARPGDRALINHLPGTEYIASFFGCLYAGVVAVPVYPPRFNQSLERIKSIVTDGTARVALTSSAILESLRPVIDSSPELATVDWLVTDRDFGSLHEEWMDPGVNGQDLAFIQYTSGSTSQPKGVMLSHENLIVNLSAICQFFGASPDSRGVIWLPPYHDMGLIGGLLAPMLEGFPVTLMSPYSFLQRPIRWLEMISRTRATVSGAPNFAYDLCLNRLTDEQVAGLDLSSWELAFCGAEPIQVDVMEKFAKRFAPQGFKRKAFYPCYGLAESTLLLSGPDHREGPMVRRIDAHLLQTEHRAQVVEASDPNGRDLFGCGAAPAGHEIRIVDPENRTPMKVGEVGEIWFSGPSVAKGYWGQTLLSEETFRAEIEGEKGTYLRTGDLGFMLDGQLFITGRIKDLIIIRGRNVYPQDLEVTSGRAHAAARAGATAVFSILSEKHEELLVVVQEMERRARDADLSEVSKTIREAIFQEHGLKVDTVCLIRTNSIPLTTSGKIKRHECRKKFVSGELTELFRDPS